MSRSWLLPVIVAALVAALVAEVGMTMTDLGPWYHGLRQPDWAPADAAYGAAWTLIYALTALAGVTAWRASRRTADRELLLGAFAANGFLNIVWSLLFFRMRRPDLAFYEGLLLWVSVAALVWVAARVSRPAALLLLPYLAWVTFALTLNFAVVRLNGPF